MLATLSQNDLETKNKLEESVVKGIEIGKGGFFQAAQALLTIDELALWRDEAASFDAYRQKFKDQLDGDISDRHLNRLVAAARCVKVLRPTGLEVPEKERHIRPLTQLKEPKQIQQAYQRAMELAQNEGEKLKAEHVEKAVAEIKPPKVKLPKSPRPPINSNVVISDQYPDEEFHGRQGVVMQHPSIDRCIVRFEDDTSKLIPDSMLKLVESVHVTSTKQESKVTARSLGLKTGSQTLPDKPLTQDQQEDIEVAIAAFLRTLPKLSSQQKQMIYEQLLKTGFTPAPMVKEVAA